MNAEIYQISFDQFVDMLMDYPDKEVAVYAAKLSAEILVGIYEDKPLCFVGLIPKTLISDSAYVWMITTEFGEDHGLIIARYSRGFIDVALEKYRQLFGHCFNDRSARWLRRLGVEFISDSEFEIGRA